MIDENLVQSAIKIRREYLSLSSNMHFYRKKASDVVTRLEEFQNELTKIQNNLKNRTDITSEDALKQISKVLDDTELEGKKLEESLKPLNEKIEKLGQQEAELWRNIKLKHSDTPENDIIEYVRQRLIKENLS
jgi:predicted  nucleic acid-binding Zn-ribbon protein